MPEGDTLHKIAAALRPDLAGERVERLWLRDAGDVTKLVGRRVESVEAIGKHLVVSLSGDWHLRTHLGMKGSWHRYRPGERWQRARSTASVELATEGWVFVCFRASQVELTRAASSGDLARVAKLGPDVLGAELDLDEVISRARRLGADREIGEVLLDQRVAAGIGNVYKSEIPFLEGVHPRTPLGELDDEGLRALYRRARDLMKKNLHTPARVTRDSGPRYWVYRRAGRPCLRCGTPIRRFLQGEQARSTFWCPRCQPDA